MNKQRLTIIILNHNTKDLLRDCINSVEKHKREIPLSLIVSDNDSTDGSVEMVTKSFPWAKVVKGPNISFAQGNNRAKNLVKSEYVLFLNSDTVVRKDVFSKTVSFLDSNKKVGALSCKLVLPDGKPDKDARRKFPTPWISFKRLFFKNGREYWYEDVDFNSTLEVDSIQGAFFLTRKKLLDELGWFDENYIFDGEDIDLCFRIKKLGYKIIYYPEATVLHIKKATRKILPKEVSLRRRMEGVNTMEYFYKKNLWKDNLLIVNYLVLLGIKMVKIARFTKGLLIR